jgi:hypothetical protein
MINVLHESDNGHGWLIVKASAVKALGLTANDFTHYSYTSVIDGERVFALEEDCDAYKLHTTCKAQSIEWNYTERTCTSSDVRNWDSIERIQSHALELAVM